MPATLVTMQRKDRAAALHLLQTANPSGDRLPLPTAVRNVIGGPCPPVFGVMTVHFWAARELKSAVTGAGFAAVMQLRPQTPWRADRSAGLWLRWEGSYRRAA